MLLNNVSFANSDVQEDLLKYKKPRFSRLFRAGGSTEVIKTCNVEPPPTIEDDAFQLRQLVPR
jgi:hypothetical protein